MKPTRHQRAEAGKRGWRRRRFNQRKAAFIQEARAKYPDTNDGRLAAEIDGSAKAVANELIRDFLDLP